MQRKKHARIQANVLNAMHRAKCMTLMDEVVIFTISHSIFIQLIIFYMHDNTDTRKLLMSFSLVLFHFISFHFILRLSLACTSADPHSHLTCNQRHCQENFQFRLFNLSDFFFFEAKNNLNLIATLFALLSLTWSGFLHKIS